MPCPPRAALGSRFPRYMRPAVSFFERSFNLPASTVDARQTLSSFIYHKDTVAKIRATDQSVCRSTQRPHSLNAGLRDTHSPRSEGGG